MNNIAIRVFWGVVIVLCIGLFCWYFHSIIAYILLAAIVSFLGQPLADKLGRIRVFGYQPTRTVCAGLSLLVIWIVFVAFLMAIVPLITVEIQNIENIHTEELISQMEGPLSKASISLHKLGLIGDTEKAEEYLREQATSFLDITRVRAIFSSFAGAISDFFIAIFAVTFISFFFIKDSHLFSQIVLSLLPVKYEVGGQKALSSIQRLLVRYFVGILIEMSIVMTLNTVGIFCFGFNFSTALVIGLMSGILVIIPYIGPFIGITLASLIGFINIGITSELLTFMPIVGIIGMMLLTQLLDNILFQPYIYGNSVYAHPLEIFIVILMAGNIAGIPGMMLAIPSYTVLRVILREFFNKYKLVKRLTKNLKSESSNVSQ